MMRRLSGTVRQVLRAAAAAVLGFLAVIVLALAAPQLVGLRPLTILSGSMAPTLDTLDVVVVDRIAPLDAGIGDIVSFRDPQNADRLVTHRVLEMRTDGRLVRFVTSGDANDASEEWTVVADGTIGRVRYRVPYAGYALYPLRFAAGKIMLLVVPAVLLAVGELRQIRRLRGVREDPTPVGGIALRRDHAAEPMPTSVIPDGVPVTTAAEEPAVPA